MKTRAEAYAAATTGERESESFWKKTQAESREKIRLKIEKNRRSQMDHLADDNFLDDEDRAGKKVPPFTVVQRPNKKHQDASKACQERKAEEEDESAIKE